MNAGVGRTSGETAGIAEELAHIRERSLTLTFYWKRRIFP
jgi:hypothetical protein